jgi:hypothetical protein
MKYPVRALIFFLATILLFVAAGKSSVSAQDGNEPSGFQDVQLWVYPEYDDPRLLVMLEGQIVGAQFPKEVRFLVPSTAEMYSAGSKDAQGQYTGGPPQREPSSIPGWDEISYDAKHSTFRVEYYDPIIIGQPDKSISYEFRWLYPISGLEIIIQEPKNTTDFSVSPAGKVFVDNQGFTSHLYNHSRLDNEPSLQFDIIYSKSDTKPSLAIEDEGTPNYLLAVIIALALGIAVVGVFLWMKKSKPRTRAERRQQARNTNALKPADNQRKARFCRQCGKPIEGSFKFCPHCGGKA